VAVLTRPPTRGGGTTVGTVAETLGIDTMPSERVRDPELAGWMTDREVDLLLNVHSLHLIDGAVVAAPRIGSFNVHPGPLPRYAGLNVPSWAIYQGEKRHAVTVHWMEAGIDTGRIAYETAFDITDDDTGLSVSVRCAREGVTLVSRLLEAAETGDIPSIEQDPSGRRYFGREIPEDGRVVWSHPARQVADLVRACDYFPFASPWGLPRARLDGREVAVTKVSRTGEAAGGAEPGTVSATFEEGARVATGDEWLLVRRLQLDGEALPAESVLAAGMRLGDGV
jgi:UDP-4-amino-4-deoxy-L-arabinose formyltransferase/UDP-glucuronic acid dehydrogenase (UDP-4-keto-hexauronic acid decarboxylating)